MRFVLEYGRQIMKRQNSQSDTVIVSDWSQVRSKQPLFQRRGQRDHQNFAGCAAALIVAVGVKLANIEVVIVSNRNHRIIQDGDAFDFSWNAL